MNFRGVGDAMKAFVQATGNDTVSGEEILRRTNICKECDFRSTPLGIKSKASRTLGAIANRNKVHRDLKDYACGVCECSLLLLVPSKIPHRDSPEKAALRPAKCWMKQVQGDAPSASA